LSADGMRAARNNSAKTGFDRERGYLNFLKRDFRFSIAILRAAAGIFDFGTSGPATPNTGPVPRPGLPSTSVERLGWGG
jgi:hypothetical protein